MNEKYDIFLTREVRLAAALDHSAPGEANNFAANPPPPHGVAPVVTLVVRIAGAVDPISGMLVNIKHIDHVVRNIAAPAITALLRPEMPPAATAPALTGLLYQCAAALVPYTLVDLTVNISPWMYFQAIAGDVPMITMAQKFEFSAAHRLHSPTLSSEQNVELFGKCNNPNGHGHNYELEVLIGGTPDAHAGLIMPLADFQRLVNRHVITIFDHKHLNMDCPEFAVLNPTVENIAQVIFAKLVHVFPAGVTLRAIKVWETPKTCCEIRAR